jgi:hypothetical protein
MQQPAKINYKVYQGATFQEIYRWESQTKVYTPISQISKSAPCVITTTTASNIPIGWRFRVVGVVGMKEINTTSEDSWYIATGVNGTQITINQVNSLAYTTYTSGGVVEYNDWVGLNNLTARMQIRETVESPTVIYQCGTQTGEIVIDQVNKTITITIPATITEDFTFETAVYSVELVDQQGIVTPFLTGNLVLVKEVTR